MESKPASNIPDASGGHKTPATQIFVVIHGIGDQVRYQAMQDVLGRFTVYTGAKARVPLGQLASGQASSGVYEHPTPAAPNACTSLSPAREVDTLPFKLDVDYVTERRGTPGIGGAFFSVMSLSPLLLLRNVGFKFGL